MPAAPRLRRPLVAARLPGPELDAVAEQRLGRDRQRQGHSASGALELLLDLGDQSPGGVAGQATGLHELALDDRAREPRLPEVDDLDHDRDQLQRWQYHGTLALGVPPDGAARLRGRPSAARKRRPEAP